MAVSMEDQHYAAGALLFTLSTPLSPPSSSTDTWTSLNYPYPTPTFTPSPDSPDPHTWRLLTCLCSSGLMSATYTSRTIPSQPSTSTSPSELRERHPLYVRVYIEHLSMGRRQGAVDHFTRLYKEGGAKEKGKGKMSVGLAIRTILGCVRRERGAWEGADEGQEEWFFDQLKVRSYV